MPPITHARDSFKTDRGGKPRGVMMALFAAGFLVLLIIEQLLPSPGATALLALWSALAAWWCGRFAAMVLAVAALGIRFGMAPPDTAASGVLLLVNGAAYIGLIAWIAELHRRLIRESYLARHDSLTGLANRQAIVEQCQAEISRAARFRRPFTLIMLDLNAFKEINDRYGHPTGDKVLCRTASALSDAVRRYDLVGRLGGDEFVILLPEAGSDAAQIVVQRLQVALQSWGEAACPPVTFSIGAVTWLSAPRDVAECLAAVDRLLYDAKTSKSGAPQFEIISGPAVDPMNHKN